MRTPGHSPALLLDGNVTLFLLSAMDTQDLGAYHKKHKQQKVMLHLFHFIITGVGKGGYKNDSATLNWPLRQIMGK